MKNREAMLSGLGRLLGGQIGLYVGGDVAWL